MAMENKIGVFTHIEKTAGTTIRYSLEQALGKKNVFIYSPEADRLARSSDNLMPATTPILDKVRTAFTNPVLGPILVNVWPAINGIYRERIRRKYAGLELPADAKIIMGHFSADKFDQIYKEREPIFATVIRDPLERAKSHYNHWIRNRGFEDWRVHIPFNKNMTFEEFALLKQLKNYQTQALAGKNIKSFSIIGVTEHTDKFIHKLLMRLTQEGFDLNIRDGKIPKKSLNVNGDKSQKKLTKEFLGVFKMQHNEDYALYAEALSLSKE